MTSNKRRIPLTKSQVCRLGFGFLVSKYGNDLRFRDQIVFAKFRDIIPVGLFLEELRASNIKTRMQYKSEYRRRFGWPSQPQKKYGIKWSELFGRKKTFLDYDQFLAELKLSGIATSKEYESEYKNNPGWPCEPWKFYGVKRSEIFGSQKTRKTRFLDYDSFLVELRSSGVRTGREYQLEYKKHSGWPNRPSKVYGRTWSQMIGKYSFLPYEAFLVQISIGGIKYIQDYKCEYKKHADWPSNPWKFYQVSWSEMQRVISIAKDLVRVAGSVGKAIKAIRLASVGK